MKYEIASRPTITISRAKGVVRLGNFFNNNNYYNEMTQFRGSWKDYLIPGESTNYWRWGAIWNEKSKRETAFMHLFHGSNPIKGFRLSAGHWNFRRCEMPMHTRNFHTWTSLALSTKGKRIFTLGICPVRFGNSFHDVPVFDTHFELGFWARRNFLAGQLAKSEGEQRA